MHTQYRPEAATVRREHARLEVEQFLPYATRKLKHRSGYGAIRNPKTQLHGVSAWLMRAAPHREPGHRQSRHSWESLPRVHLPTWNCIHSFFVRLLAFAFEAFATLASSCRAWRKHQWRSFPLTFGYRGGRPGTRLYQSTHFASHFRDFVDGITQRPPLP